MALSQAGALPEIAGDAALYFQPDSPEDMAEKMIEILDKKELQKQLTAIGRKRSREFSWEKTSKTAELKQEVLGITH